MSHLLYINASPRGAQSASTQAAHTFLAALAEGVEVTTLELFDMPLADYTPILAAAKQAAGMGAELDSEQAAEWSQVTHLVDQFVAADHLLFAVPMWNFSIPYKLKQYIDLITHPGLTFTRDANGMRGLASGAATVIYARGGDYSPKNGQPDPFDFQSPYLEAWLNLVGIASVSTVLVQRTMMGPEVLDDALTQASVSLQTLAAKLG